MTTLLVGFDSAWTPKNSGAIVGTLQLDRGEYKELGTPRRVDYPQAEGAILAWQAEHAPTATIVLLDQPTVVTNAVGQRPVDNIVSSAVSLRYGGMQPANLGKPAMFGTEAPVWTFLTRFGGAPDPLEPIPITAVFETYPVLTMIALGWTLTDSRPAGRLPKYNPQRRKSFSLTDWRHVCAQTTAALSDRGLAALAAWVDEAAGNPSPRKRDQDRLDACLCLLVALDLAEGRRCLMVGDLQTGYIVVPDSALLREELEARCCRTRRAGGDWVRAFRLRRRETRQWSPS